MSRNHADWDTRPIELSIIWTDAAGGGATLYRRTAEELPRLLEELMNGYNQQWQSFTVSAA